MPERVEQIMMERTVEELGQEAPPVATGAEEAAAAVDRLVGEEDQTGQVGSSGWEEHR